MEKTTTQHLQTGAKYSATSLTLAVSITEILMFAQPEWLPIKEYVLALLAFFINLIMIYVIRKTENASGNRN